MSIFSELLPKLSEISNAFTKNLNDELKVALECLEKFEEEYQNGRSKAREKAQKDKNAMTTLQSINEDEDEPKKLSDPETSKRRSSEQAYETASRGSDESSLERRASKKRNKNEVDGISSPDQDKRLKRNASVKAQSIISKQVNVNLTQKLRRENSTEKLDKNQTRGRRQKDDEKENLEPALPAVQIKQEKISLPQEPEPMDTEPLPVNASVKQEVDNDGIAMPPPAAPVPRPRKGAGKEKPQEETTDEESSGRRRRTRKQTDSALVPASRSTRASSRAQRSPERAEPPAPEGRPKRTRTKKKLSDGSWGSELAPSSQESLSASRSRGQRSPERAELPAPEGRPKRTRTKKKLSDASRGSELAPSSQESLPASPAEKPRPKRTRRGQKMAEKEQPKPVEPNPTSISPKEERISDTEPSSPILPQKDIKTLKNKKDNTNPEIDLTKTKEMVKTISVEKALIKTNSIDKELIKTNSVDKDLLKTNSVDKELIKTNSVDKDLLKTNNVDKELIKTNSVDKDLLKTNSVDKALIKTDSVDKELIKTNSFDKELTKSKNTDKDLPKTKNTENDFPKAKITENDLADTKITVKDFAKTKNTDKEMATSKSVKSDEVDNITLDETRVVTKGIEMDQTMVLPNGVYNHAPVTPKNIRNMNETVVLDRCDRETMVLDKPQPTIMDSTVVLDKGPKIEDLCEDNSLLTDDSDEIPLTPPKNEIPVTQPTSAVKEKVQQFEELASRVTRTKTRAMAKKEEEGDSHTPPDKVSKALLSCETLTKMNSLIFNGKAPQISSSASKPKAYVPTKPAVPSSASKLSAINRAREVAEENLKREDARKKKEAMLEAKREQQRRRREEKMAAAAAAREAASRSRAAALHAAAREREERQAHADMGRVERMRDHERKKQELARKVAETEERRKAEEAARQQRLAEEQKRAMEQRRKQIEEQEAMRKEAAIMAKEIEQKHREYIEKQKKQRHEDKMHTPLKVPGTPLARADPVYMEDGFQYLNSDEEQEPAERPVPLWSTSKYRRHQLSVQALVETRHVDRLFSVRAHSCDLRDLFPGIERARLKRTSSAVWRTPPHLATVRE